MSTQTIWTPEATLPQDKMSPALILRWQSQNGRTKDGVTPSELLRIVANRLEEAEVTAHEVDVASAEAVLNTPMQENDAEAATVREYLRTLLSTLWREEEDFDGKRPFGNSGWKGEVTLALVKADLIDGGINSEGLLDWAEYDDADGLITDCIDHLFHA